ncbi:MAG TPA: gliding motility protein GldM [Flavisolibacter sp.]|jgi:gliding motility-associated protein GldM|nr:gliding motility protein GldM [Flavisolibacter sp.]
MALPAEPRQKMINLMYLVLTAMLALNVSAEILNAFKIVDSSLIGTNGTVNTSTNTIMASLQGLTTDATKAEKAKIWYANALKAQQLTSTTYNEIQSMRNKILKESGFDPVKNGDSTFKQDNLDIATRIMVEEGEGKKLQQILTNYKTSLLAIDPAIAREFANSLQVDVSMPKVQNKSNKTWEAAYFHMVPTVAAITILSKFQNDVKTSENKVVAFCHQQVGQVEVKFDAFEAIVGQNSKYLMPGQELEITAGLGAFSKQKVPTITIGGSNIKPGENGMATYKMASGGIGSHSVPVTVAFVDQDGKPQTRTYNVEYTVGQANASIALDKMNVLYIGVPNPITVAASGGGDDKVAVSIVGGGGRLEKTGPGKYNVFVNSITDNAKISVAVEGKVAGVSEFRVRTIPDPVATVGGYASGDNINVNAFKAQSGVGAYIKDFPLDLKYTVTQFSIIGDTEDGDIAEATVNGNTWDAKALGVLKKLKAGGLVSIEGIRAMGPDGKSRKLPSIFYNLR